MDHGVSCSLPTVPCPRCAVQVEWVSLGLCIAAVCVLRKCADTFSTVSGRRRSVFPSLKCTLIWSAQCEIPGPHVSLDSVVCKMLCVFKCFFSFSYCCACSAFLPIRIYGVSSQPPRKGGTRITNCSFCKEWGKDSTSSYFSLLAFSWTLFFSYPVFSWTLTRTNKSPEGEGEYRKIYDHKIKDYESTCVWKRILYCTVLQFQHFPSLKCLTLQP